MLAAFLKVADSASVSRAARELDVGKSVVSKRVAQLEAQVGATLFARSTRRIALTPAGEAYADFARRALAEMAAGEERLRALRSELTGRIRLSATVSWGQRVLAGKLPEFLRLHPAIELELQLADRLVDVAYERIDIALRWSTTPPQGLACEPVAVVGWSIVATPAYLADAGTPQRPEDLARHSCLSYWREASDDLWTLAQAGAMAQVRVRGRYHVDNPEAVAEAALAGLGIALLPDYLCQSGLADGRLQRVLPGWTPQTKFGSLISAVSTAERLRLPRNQVLLGFLKQQLGTG
ncbi:LysR family transcriptional regulator [Leptothrix sp. BB-4]